MGEMILMMIPLGMLAFALLIIVSLWMVFQKANKPGWAAIVPVYNILVMLEIVGRPWWWIFFFLLTLIPLLGFLVALVLSFLVNLDLAKSFGKDMAFAFGLTLLGFIFYPILGFGDATYKGPAAKPA